MDVGLGLHQDQSAPCPGKRVPLRAAGGPEVGEGLNRQGHPQPVENLLIPVLPEALGLKRRKPLDRAFESQRIAKLRIHQVGSGVYQPLNPFQAPARSSLLDHSHRCLRRSLW